MPFFSEFG